MLGLIVLLAVAFVSSPALADDVPADLNGHWAIDNKCDSPENALHIGDGMATLGTGDAMAITYFADDSPAGNGAIHWAEEGNVDNFEYAKDRDELLYNSEGYGMGIAPTVYSRCD